MLGLKIAALYSFPAQRFGLCGMSREKANLFEMLIENRIGNLREILETFQGAFLYYSLIAKENKIKDPFDKMVVRAYWIGNFFLEKVRVSKLKAMVDNKFKKPKLARILPENSICHHSFHVLVAGPIQKDLILTEGMKDLCKISWGKVLKIEDNKLAMANLIVEYQPILKEKKWFLAKPTKRKIFYHKKFLPRVKIGDFVSFHWDFAIEKLSKKDLENLEKYTALSIKIANFLKK
jgi:hydrogenase maturation factor